MQVRHGPAAVTGDKTGTMPLASLQGRRRSEDDPEVRRPACMLALKPIAEAARLQNWGLRKKGCNPQFSAEEGWVFFCQSYNLPFSLSLGALPVWIGASRPAVFSFPNAVAREIAQPWQRGKHTAKKKIFPDKSLAINEVIIYISINY